VKHSFQKTARRRARLAPALGAALALLAAVPVAAAQEPREGRVEFSDGTLVDGKISLTPGGSLKIETGPQIRVLDLDRVREIRLSPEKEEMDRKWRFKAAGQTAKEYFGEPYPVRSLQATVLLAGGESFTGHLYSTVLYVEGAENAQKVLLLSRQSGGEGQTFKDLVYPTRISFAGATVAEATAATLRFKGFDLTSKAEIAVLTRGALVRLEAAPAGPPGEFKMPSPWGREFFLAIKTGGKIVAAWPSAKDAKTLAQVQNALPKSEDFFDERRVLGVFRDPAAAEIYSLLLAARKGGTTLDEKRSQPWRLEVYRWKTEEGSDRLMLAGQGWLFRGIDAKNAAAPAVELSDKLWHIEKNGDTWTVGE